MSDLQQRGAGSKDYAIDAGKCAIESHLQRMGENGKVVVTPYFGFYRIEYGINTENKTEDYVLFADQSLKPLNADWKQILYADCDRKKIGVVGGKIYDRHHRIYEVCIFEKGDWTGAHVVKMYFLAYEKDMEVICIELIYKWIVKGF